MITQPDRPLAGRRVLEVGGSVAVAAATKLFADYGADVIKVEPIGGAAVRRLPPFPGDVPGIETGAFHAALDTAKRSLVLDLEVASGRAVLDALLRQLNLVFVDAAGADGGRLREATRALGGRAPSIVVLSAHGLEGPFAGRRENDLSLFAWSGRMRQHAVAGEEPLRYAPQVASMQWGATAGAVGVAALLDHGSEAGAREIEVAGIEALAGNVDAWFLTWEFSGAEMPRAAGPSKIAYPAGCYRCADGLVLFAAATEPFFTRLCQGIGHPELATDQRFTDPAQKAQHFDDFMGHLGPWLQARTRNEVFTTLQSHGVMVAPMLDASELEADPQARARGSFVSMPLPGGASTTVAAPPLRVAEGREVRPAPLLGQHTDEILGELGYSPVERIALFRAGVTG